MFHKFRSLFFLVPLLLTGFVSMAQQPDKPYMRKAEDSLKKLARQMILDSSRQNRFEANGHFVQLLVKALGTPYSFQYPFDSLSTISILNAPDNRFRLFTWQLERDEAYFRQYGALQVNTPDGKLKIFPLFDVSDFTDRPCDSVRDAAHWIGAIYYKILLNNYKGKPVYTLLGYDDNNYLTTRKWIDILQFAPDGSPRFGGSFFNYKYDTIKVEPPVARFLYEYKKDARARLNYDPELQKIVFDHLISENNHPWDQMTLVPNGDYEGFVWKDGKWQHVEDLFGNQTKNQTLPVPKPQDEKEVW